MVENQTTKIQTLSSTQTTQIKSPGKASGGLPKGMKKSLFGAIEKEGGILNFHNRNGAKEQPISNLLDTLEGYGPKGTIPRRQAQQVCNYWYGIYCKDKHQYDALYEKFEVKPIVTTIDRLKKTNKKTEEEETEEETEEKTVASPIM